MYAFDTEMYHDVISLQFQEGGEGEMEGGGGGGEGGEDLDFGMYSCIILQ